MPVNLRRSIDRRMPAANVVSLSFLDREPNQLADPIGLLGSLHAQTAQTKRFRDVLAFVPALKLLGRFPGQLNARMQRTHCQASAVLSNLGLIGAGCPLMGRDRRMVSGGLILESIETALPLRPLTHAAFFVLNYGGRLCLTISRDPRWLDAADGCELLESYVRQLKVSLAPPNGAATVEFSGRHPSEEAPATIHPQLQSIGA